MTIRPIIGLFVLGAGLFLMSGRSVEARPVTGKKAAVKSMTDAQLISELRKNNVILAQANGDYKGHRAAAFKKIQAAVRILAKEAKVNVKPVKLTSGKEGQRLSDAQLKVVIADLQGILNQINGLRATKARTLAAENLVAAIAQLQKALMVA